VGFAERSAGQAGGDDAGEVGAFEDVFVTLDLDPPVVCVVAVNPEPTGTTPS
jgi:hypothetical protein